MPIGFRMPSSQFHYLHGDDDYLRMMDTSAGVLSFLITDVPVSFFLLVFIFNRAVACA
jgi:hypothetical protein